jgi:hypothetical protein
MRSRSLLLVAVALATLGAAPASARKKTALRCCVDLQIPDIPPGPVCVQVSAHRPAFACRVIGGQAKGRGDCSLALCRPAAQ